MIKVISSKFNPIKSTAEVKIFADAKEDLETVDLGYTLEMGSMAITADGDIAFLKSTGEWNWISGGGGGEATSNKVGIGKVDFMKLLS